MFLQCRTKAHVVHIYTYLWITRFLANISFKVNQKYLLAKDLIFQKHSHRTLTVKFTCRSSRHFAHFLHMDKLFEKFANQNLCCKLQLLFTPIRKCHYSTRCYIGRIVYLQARSYNFYQSVFDAKGCIELSSA